MSFLDNVDQRLTQDVKDFTTRMAELLRTAIISPLVIVYYSAYLWVVFGWLAPVLCLAYFSLGSLVTCLVLRRTDLVGSSQQQQRLEGELRAKHAHCLQHQSSIRLLGGQQWERRALRGSFSGLALHSSRLLARLLTAQLATNWVDYCGSIANYAIVGGAMLGQARSRSPADLARGSFACLYLLGAYSALVDCAPLLARACGAATRVHALLTALDPPPPPASPCPDMEEGLALTSLARAPLLFPEPQDPCEAPLLHFFRPPASQEERTLLSLDLVVHLAGPHGRTALLRSQGVLQVRAGMRVLLRGPSGCGKSTLLQVLAGVVPGGVCCSGRVVLQCSPGQLAVCPQSPFCFQGSLRANLLYPEPPLPLTAPSEELAREAARCGKALEAAGLEKFLQWLPQGPEELEQDWSGRASQGERQRLVLARLLLRDPPPALALLDEPSSGLDDPAQQRLFRALHGRCCTSICAGHGEALRPLHTHLLTIGPDGRMDMTPIT